jgi:hypothetical protein
MMQSEVDLHLRQYKRERVREHLPKERFWLFLLIEAKIELYP